MAGPFIELLFYKKKEFPKTIPYTSINLKDYKPALRSAVPLVELNDTPYQMYIMCSKGLFNPAACLDREDIRHGDLLKVTDSNGAVYLMLLADPEKLTIEAIKAHNGEFEEGFDLALLQVQSESML